ncbi:MAG: YbhB/YbcL family Raf kinase inhibitor-like protein [Nocardioides sp.]
MRRQPGRWAVAAALVALSGCGGGGDRLPPAGSGSDSGFTVTSSSFASGGSIPARYACPDQGDGVSPALAFAQVPDGALSLAVIAVDPDADGFVHWALAGIAPSATVAEGALPTGAVAGANDADSATATGWFGPCPPSGTHRYRVTAYALDTDPALAPGFDVSELTDAIEGHVLAQASLTATFTSRG